ncbi:MAG: hypothetical protein ACJ8FY_19665 [Gemmataceae bacterium]
MVGKQMVGRVKGYVWALYVFHKIESIGALGSLYEGFAMFQAGRALEQLVSDVSKALCDHGCGNEIIEINVEGPTSLKDDIQTWDNIVMAKLGEAKLREHLDNVPIDLTEWLKS